MVPANSHRISRVPRYSGADSLNFALSGTGLSPSSTALSRNVPLTRLINFSPVLLPRRRLNACGLGSSAFDRHYSRNHCYFLLLRVLRCFSSPRSPRLSTVTPLRAPGYPIRISPDRCAFAAPRRFSQLVTSFFATESLGILRVPFSPFLCSFADYIRFRKIVNARIFTEAARRFPRGHPRDYTSRGASALL